MNRHGGEGQASMPDLLPRGSHVSMSRLHEGSLDNAYQKWYVSTCRMKSSFWIPQRTSLCASERSCRLRPIEQLISWLTLVHSCGCRIPGSWATMTCGSFGSSKPE